MKFSAALTSIIIASCSLAGVQAAPAALFARYCLSNPAMCVNVNPVPINKCVKTHHPGVVEIFEANVSCVLHSEPNCNGPSKPMIRGEVNRPEFFAGSFLCFPP